MDFATMMALEPAAPETAGAGPDGAPDPAVADVWVGSGPQYPWGGLFGGQIVAQALRAATLTVDPAQHVHSLHAYFIRSGDAREPIRFAVERVRDGRSFATRRVTAGQRVGVILDMTASFHVDEPGTEVTLEPGPALPPFADVADETWSEVFERRVAGRRPGEILTWTRMAKPVGDDPGLQACALAYVSDDFPTEAVVSADPAWTPELDFTTQNQWFSASLDHAIWFHRPVDVDDWHVQRYVCHGLRGARGVSFGQVFNADGVLQATVTQEVLLRTRRD